MRNQVPARRARHIAKRNVLPNSMFFHLHGLPLSVREDVKVGERADCERQADNYCSERVAPVGGLVLHGLPLLVGWC